MTQPSIARTAGAPASTDGPPTLPPAAFAVLALLSATPPLSSDFYLAAFPEIRRDLHTNAASVQLTLTAFLIGIGLGQVIWGPLSDRIGRRAPLLTGCGIATVAAAVAAFAPTIEVLVAARFVQALAISAGIVLARAIISDRLDAFDTARTISLMMTISAAAPIVAPVVGGVVVGVASWRWVLGVLLAVTALQFLGSVRYLSESLPAERRTTALRYRNLLAVYRQPAFVAYSLAQMFAFGAMMAYIASSPFLYQEMMGVSSTVYGLGFALNAVGLAGAAYLSGRRAKRRIHPARTIARLGPVAVTGGIGVLVVALLPIPPGWLVLPLFVLHIGIGYTMGNFTALALHHTRDMAGAGSAVLGAQFFLFSGVISPVGGIGGEDQAVTVGLTMIGCIALSATCFALARRYVRRHPHVESDFESEPASS